MSHSFLTPMACRVKNLRVGNSINIIMLVNISLQIAITGLYLGLEMYITTVVYHNIGLNEVKPRFIDILAEIG